MNAMKNITTRFKRISGLLALFLIFTIGASAAPQVDGVSTDPAHISAGDEVDIAVNLQETAHPEKDWDPDMEMKARLEPENRLAREHSIIVQDMDRSIGFLYPETRWHQEYTVKFNGDAPTGTYEYRVAIQYLDDGEPVEITTEDGSSEITYIEKFEVDVDKKGVDLSSTVEETDPSNLRPGHNNANTQLSITNTGNKPVQNIVLEPETPEMMDPAYSKDEKFIIGRLNEGETQKINLAIDIDEEIDPGRHEVFLNAEYEDTDSNPYSDQLEVPYRIEGRPDLELNQQEHRMDAGDTKEVTLEVENTGEHTAEGSTARVLLEREQPFTLETRSDYIGDIQPGEKREAVVELTADRAASLKEHQIRVQLRSTGDSDEGDEAVYTETEHETIELEGRTTSPLAYVGVLGAITVFGGLIYIRKKELLGARSKEE